MVLQRLSDCKSNLVDQTREKEKRPTEKKKKKIEERKKGRKRKKRWRENA